MKLRGILCMALAVTLAVAFGNPTASGETSETAETVIRIGSGEACLTVTDRDANAADVLGDGSVSLAAADGTGPAVLSLRNADLPALAVDGPLILEFYGENTVRGGVCISGKVTLRGAGLLTVFGGVTLEDGGEAVLPPGMQVHVGNSENGLDSMLCEHPTAEEYLAPYVRFAPNSETVLFLSDDTCDGGLQYREHYEGMPLILPDALFAREGYTQTGWTDGESGRTYRLGEAVSGDATAYYPVWTVNRYQVTFDFGGGGETVVLTLDYGASVEVPEIPVWVGHCFCGWDRRIPETVPANNLTLRAIWKLCDHSGNTAARSCLTETACSACGARLEKVPHRAAQDDGDCTTPVTCAVCGIVLHEACAEHRLSAWEELSDGRQRRSCLCDDCTYSETRRVQPLTPPTTGTTGTAETAETAEPTGTAETGTDTKATAEREPTSDGTAADLSESGTGGQTTVLGDPLQSETDGSRNGQWDSAEKRGCRSAVSDLPAAVVLAALAVFRRKKRNED